MTDQRAPVEILAVIAAITGQTLEDAREAYEEAKPHRRNDRPASPEDVASLLAQLKTRLGLAPAVDTREVAGLRAGLDTILGESGVVFDSGELEALSAVLRRTPEHVPTVDREPVVFPPLPDHQAQMWKTLLGLEELGHPWALVGGQMTMLHCLENGVTAIRPTDDGDIVVGVWTRRDALRETSRYLRAREFREEKTSDGYGYRFVRGQGTVIDVLLPEGLERQNDYPTTISGRPGFSTEGGRQALGRAERVPVQVEDVLGYVRRPTILGAIVAKAHAYVVDSKDGDRHVQDVVTLAEIALRNPRAVLEQVRRSDRRPVRRFLRDRNAGDRYLRSASDPMAVHSLLSRLAGLDS